MPGREGFRFRSATNRDRDAVVALVKLVLPPYGLSYEADGNDADLEDIAGTYLTRGGAFEVLEDGAAALAGTYGLDPIDKRTCRLRKMYLRPELKGGGLGRLLLQRAVARARELGFRRMELETGSVLKEAIRLYTRFGFRRIESSSRSCRCDQAYALEL